MKAGKGCPVRRTVVQEEMKAAWQKAVCRNRLLRAFAAQGCPVRRTRVQDKILGFLWFWLRSLLLHSDEGDF